MEFNLEQLNRFILHLFNETSTPTNQNETDEIETIELSDDDNESDIETNVNGTNKNNDNDNNNTKHFCFIIFNNPKYSHFLKNIIVKAEKKVRILFQSNETYINIFYIITFLFRKINNDIVKVNL